MLTSDNYVNCIFQRIITVSSFLHSVKLRQFISRVCSFEPSFQCLIFLRGCNGFCLYSRRLGVYIASCYPAVVCVYILSSAGTLCLYLRPDRILERYISHLGSGFHGHLTFFLQATISSKIYLGIAQGEISIYCFQHRSIHRPRFLMQIKFYSNFSYFLV